MTENKNLLLIEDDPIIASGLVYALENAGFAVKHAANLRTAKREVASERFHLAILDIGLPDGTGFELVADLKRSGCALLFLTAVDDEGHIIRAFGCGADDYVTKPFRLGELMARINSILRRKGGGDTQSLGRATIHISDGRVLVDGAAVELTALEYRLLLCFANHKGQVLSRGQILSLLWDSEGVFVEDNTLTVYVKRLREKLGEAVRIETVRGVGYLAHDN